MRQREYLDELTAKHGSPAQLDKRAKRDETLRPLMEEWRWLAAHPERDDEIITVENDIVFHDFERFLEVLSPQRLRLLHYLREHPETDSLSELARGLGRDYRNVHGDAERLADVGVLALEHRGNRVVPRVLAERIEVEV